MLSDTYLDDKLDNAHLLDSFILSENNLPVVLKLKKDAADCLAFSNIRGLVINENGK